MGVGSTGIRRKKQLEGRVTRVPERPPRSLKYEMCHSFGAEAGPRLCPPIARAIHPFIPSSVKAERALAARPEVFLRRQSPQTPTAQALANDTRPSVASGLPAWDHQD